MYKENTTSALGTRIVEKIRANRVDLNELVPGGVTWAAAKRSSRPIRVWILARVAPGQVYAGDVSMMRRDTPRRTARDYRNELRQWIHDCVPGSGVTWAVAKTSSRPIRTWVFTRISPRRVLAEDLVLMFQASRARQTA